MDLSDEIQAIQTAAKYRAALYKLGKKLKWNSVDPLLRYALDKPNPGQPGGDRRKERLGVGLVRLFRGLFFTVFKLTAQINWKNHPERFSPEGFRRITHADLRRITRISDAELREYLRTLEECGFIERQHRKGITENKSGNVGWVTELSIRLNLTRLFQLLDEEIHCREKAPKMPRKADPLAGFWLESPADEAQTVVNRFHGVLLQYLSNWEFHMDDLVRSLKSESARTMDRRKQRIAPGTKRFLQHLITKIFKFDQMGRWANHPERFDQRGFRLISAQELAQSNCTTRELRDARKALIEARILEESHRLADGSRTKRPWIRIDFRQIRRRLEELPGKKFEVVNHIVAWVPDGTGTEGKWGKSWNLSAAVLFDVNTQYFLKYAIHFCTSADPVSFLPGTCTDLRERINGWACGSSTFPFLPEPEPEPGPEPGPDQQVTGNGERLPSQLLPFSRLIHEARESKQPWAKQFADYSTSSTVCPAACFFNCMSAEYIPLVVQEEAAMAAVLFSMILPDEQVVTPPILEKLSRLFRKRVMTLNDVALFCTDFQFGSDAYPQSFQYILRAWPTIIKSLRPDLTEDALCARDEMEWCREIVSWFTMEVARPNIFLNGEHGPLFRAIKTCRSSASSDELSKIQTDLRSHLHKFPEIYVGLRQVLNWEEYLPISTVEAAQLRRSFLERYQRNLCIELAHTDAFQKQTSLGLPAIANDRANAVKTGFEPFDRLTGGLRLGKLYLLGGYTGTGKTMLSLQLAAGLCLAKLNVWFSSSEECPGDLFLRVYSNCARTPYEQILRDRSVISELVLPPEIGNRLFIENWASTSAEKTLADRFLTGWAAPDIIIIDGIAQARTMQADRRLIQKSYEDFVIKLAEFAASSYRIVIATVQLAHTAKDQQVLTRSMILEASGMIEHAHSTIGISALTRPDGFEPWSPQQFLQSISESGEPGPKITVYREGTFQRLSETMPSD